MLVENLLTNISNVCSVSLEVIAEAKRTRGFAKAQRAFSEPSDFVRRLATFDPNDAMSPYPGGHRTDIVDGMLWMSAAIRLAREVADIHDTQGLPLGNAIFEHRRELQDAVVKWRIVERNSR